MASRRLRLRVTALLLVGVGALSGCTGSSTPTPTPSVTSTSPSPSPTLTAAQQLQHLAQLGTKAVFRATYLVRQRHPASRATWRVWRTTSSLRVDVVTKHLTATLIRTPHNTYSCSRAGHRKTCFRVPKGKPVPAPLQLLAGQLFSTNLSSLAKGSPSVNVSVSTAGSDTCFAIAPRHKNSAIVKADYCFDSAGVLSEVRYPNGNLVKAQNIATQPPSKGIFRPYASPTPVPG